MNIVGKLGIDIVVSECEVMFKWVFGFFNLGIVILCIFLFGGNIGVFEIEVFEGVLIMWGKLFDFNFFGGCFMVVIMWNEYVWVFGVND